MIPYGRHHVDEDDIRAVADVLRGPLLTQGPRAAELETRLAEYTGARYAVVVANGTAALHLACLAAGLGPGDVSVTSPITFLASANCALYTGAAAAFADIDPETLNLDPGALRALAGNGMKMDAVIPVHFAGLPCDMKVIREVAEAQGAVVIEDACHALGGTYPDGAKVGSCRHSDMTTFSFHPVKLIAAGEGGAITTNDPGLYRRLQLLRNHGMTRTASDFEDPGRARSGDLANPWYYEMQALGYNFRITDIQCALAISQMGKLERFSSRRRQLAQRYDDAFASLAHIRIPQRGCRERSGNHLYVLRIDFAALGISRADAMGRLAARGIGSQVHYIPVPDQPYYRRLSPAGGPWPHAQAYYAEALSIPLYYGMSDEDAARVIEAVTDLSAGRLAASAPSPAGNRRSP